MTVLETDKSNFDLIRPVSIHSKIHEGGPLLPSSDRPRGGLPALGAAIPLIIIFITVLSIPLAAAQDMGLSARQTTGWILGAYGLPSLLSLGLALHYRQPLMLTGNLFALIFIASLVNQLSYPELIGAFILAGAGVLLVSALGLTERLATWIPGPIVMGLLGGAIMPFVSRIFTNVGEAPVAVGGAFLAYLLSLRFLGNRLPPVLPAVVAGIVLAAASGQLGAMPARLPLPIPAITIPVFSLKAIATATPVLVILITLQANVPSLVYLQSQEYEPPERTIDAVSGVGTALGSLLGPMAVSLSLPASALVGGPQAGRRQGRYQAVLVVAGAGVLIALLAGLAADLPEVIPRPLLLALAGLAMVAVLGNALKEITRGPLLLGPMFAFAIALSDISLLGFGPEFWSLVVGTGVSLLLERRALQEWRTQAAAG